MQNLPLRTTFMVHIIAAWLLKVPLWPSDLIHGARCGRLPYLDFAALAKEAPMPAGAERLNAKMSEYHPMMTPKLLAMRAQLLAKQLQIVVPELNLGVPH